MEKLQQSASDVERKLTKINSLMSKGVSKMTMNDMIKQARKGNSVKHTIKKGIRSSDVNSYFHPRNIPSTFSRNENDH
jgi:hypothetical protein